MTQTLKETIARYLKMNHTCDVDDCCLEDKKHTNTILSLVLNEVREIAENELIELSPEVSPCSNQVSRDKAQQNNETIHRFLSKLAEIEKGNI